MSVTGTVSGISFYLTRPDLDFERCHDIRVPKLLCKGVKSQKPDVLQSLSCPFRSTTGDLLEGRVSCSSLGTLGRFRAAHGE